jgi:hypothetical protein
MTYLYSIDAPLLLLAALGIAILAAGAGQFVVHRLFRSRDFIAHNEVGGIVITVTGALYAVILGFLTVVAWQHFQEAREVVVLESAADIDAWHTAVGLPQPVRERVRTDMLKYAEIMIDSEWPKMQQGKFDLTAGKVGMDAIDAVGTLVPANAGESNAQVATLQQLGTMHDGRQRRIGINDSGVSDFEWLVLLIGGGSITCFCWLFGLKNQRVQFLMTSAVVTMIVSILVLLFELQYPFRSDIGVGSDAWRGALKHLHEMQSGAMPGMR